MYGRKSIRYDREDKRLSPPSISQIKSQHRYFEYQSEVFSDDTQLYAEL